MAGLWPFRRRKRGVDEPRALTYQDIFASGGDVGSRRGVDVDAALSLVPMLAATRVLADGVASLPLQAFKDRGEYAERVSDPQFLPDPRKYKSHNGTRYDWLHRAMTSLVLWGNAYGLIAGRDRHGTPTAIVWLDPAEVSLKDDDMAAAPEWRWEDRPVDAADMVHIAGYTVPGRRLGLSPVGVLKQTLETGLYAAEFGRDWFESGSVPAAVLETQNPIQMPEAVSLKRRFQAAAKRREPVVLSNGLSYRPISVNADESQFLATLRLNATQIAAVYGIPPEMIGGESGNSLTYANVEQQTANFVTYTLRPWLVRIEQALSALLPRGTFLRFNADAIVRADLKTRYEAHAIAVNTGWLSLNEVREIEDLPPLPDGLGGFQLPQQGSTPGEGPPEDGNG